MITKTYYHNRTEWKRLRGIQIDDADIARDYPDGRPESLPDPIPGFGCSEIGAMYGVNPWQSAYTMMARKLGRIKPVEDNEHLRQGRDLEDYVARRFSELTGWAVRRANCVWRNDSFPGLLASIDREIAGQDSGLECKTCSAFNLQAYSNGNFPAQYYCQCVGYLAVTEKRTWYLAALILGVEFKVFAMTRDPDFKKPEWCEDFVYVPDSEFDTLKPILKQYMSWLQHGVMPPVDGQESTVATLTEIYADRKPETADLTAFGEKLKLRSDYKAQEKAAKEAACQIENEIREFMGSASVGTCGSTTVSWKTSTYHTLDADALTDHFGGTIPDEFYKDTERVSFRVTTKKGRK